MKKLMVSLTVLVMYLSAFPQTVTFNVGGESKHDLVTFTSHAPLETVEGKTSHVVGFVAVDPADISAADAKFVVDLTTLKTGIDMRDRHMRENHLETDKFPDAVFELRQVTAEDGCDLSDGKPRDITLIGDFTVHGITRPTEVKATVQYYSDGVSDPVKLAGKTLHIIAKFIVALPDYEIERPQFLIMKLDEKQEINIDLWASTELPAPEF